ncbi:T9SS sorting signal type C domain-containing protein [Flavobacterium psychrotolerans]|uniref:T9SS C-terminal target domain-containing protein n=1 Tax=Flavobacterium psychrotolerans TaxID=2169410 RepID=A0A2U1JG96_9FLAO|nr:T9SS sorting signal type C domain-containing protein [Flavobacterium psychrotolerans]PWA03958.1 hypothetical protein DB895_13530 [Flavobacterium psychrotolerans]
MEKRYHNSNSMAKMLFLVSLFGLNTTFGRTKTTYESTNRDRNAEAKFSPIDDLIKPVNSALKLLPVNETCANKTKSSSRNSNAALSSISLYKLSLTGSNGVYSQLAVGYSADFTLGVDRGIDGSNINNTNYFCSTIIESAYSIQGRPEFTPTDIVSLQYKIGNASTYSICIDSFDGIFKTQSIYIKDNLTNTIHDLKSGPYSFSSEAGNFASRFEIVYQNLLAAHQPTFNEKSVVTYKQYQDVMITSGQVMLSSVKIFDSSGRLLVSKNNINATQTKLFTGSNPEVLIVQITSTENDIITKKMAN